MLKNNLSIKNSKREILIKYNEFLNLKDLFNLLFYNLCV